MKDKILSVFRWLKGKFDEEKKQTEVEKPKAAKATRKKSTGNTKKTRARKG
jgi:hypothetical protein